MVSTGLVFYNSGMDPNKIIDQLGGSLKVAQLCKVTVGAVSQWRRAGIPRARLMYLQAIRPDVFAEPVDPAPVFSPSALGQEAA